MPISPAQHGFFRLVRSVQQGEVPLDGVDKHISDSAKRMKPRDSSEFPAAKHKAFPKIKDTTEKRITSKAAAALNLALYTVKAADISTTINKTRKALDRASMQRTKTMKSYAESMRKHNEMLAKKVQDSEARAIQSESKVQAAELKSQQAQAKAQEAISAQGAATMPSLPQGQPAYGAIAQQQQMMQQEAAGNSQPKMPAMPVM